MSTETNVAGTSSGDCRYTEEEILAFVAGTDAAPTGGTDADQAVAEHLAECAGCRTTAVEYRALEELLEECCEREVVRWHRFETPFGDMYVATTDRGLARVAWRQHGDDDFVEEIQGRFEGQPVVRDPDGLAEVERQLTEYFSGRRERFDLPVDLETLSPFEQEVLGAARRLGHGQVIPYAELARRVGRPRAYRAVGNALGKNPVAIVVPCHRVIRSDGSLGGYGGGEAYKEYLLRLEGREDLLLAG